VRQRIIHGKELDFATPEEIAALINEPPAPGDRGREAGYSGLFDVVIGDFDHAEPVLLVSPPARRLRITRHAHGGPAIAVTQAPMSLLIANEGRMGITIVNYGANNLFLYLGALDDVIGGAQMGVLWLKSGGGSWDGSFTEGLWGGNVCGAADNVAGTTISLCEV
jgi:hypothetical protein